MCCTALLRTSLRRAAPYSCVIISDGCMHAVHNPLLRAHAPSTGALRARASESCTISQITANPHNIIHIVLIALATLLPSTPCDGSVLVIPSPRCGTTNAHPWVAK